MLNFATQDLYDTCKQFLQKSRCQRLLQLQQLGLARYADFLTQMRLNEVNILCVMRFLHNPSRVKFPQLQGADLSNLILDGSNLIRGDLSKANLQGTSLINADLIFANLTNADLRNTNLTGATLNETIWQGAKVENCVFGEGIGLTKIQRENLRLRAALFN